MSGGAQRKAGKLEMGTAELLISNACIWTGNASMPFAEAIAIQGERILAVGSNRELAALRGAKTQVYMAAGI